MNRIRMVGCQRPSRLVTERRSVGIHGGTQVMRQMKRRLISRSASNAERISAQPQGN